MTWTVDIDECLSELTSRRVDRILVVDDEAPIVTVATEALRHAGFETDGVTSAVEALEMSIEPYSVLVTDFRIPEVNGIELFCQLRQANPDLVGVMVTGYGSLRLVQTAMRRGFSAILLKPFPLERLTSAVERALRQRRLAEENHRLEAVLDVYSVGRELTQPRTRAELADRLAQLARDSVAATGAAVLLTDPPEDDLRLPGPGSVLKMGWARELSGLALRAAKRQVVARDEIQPTFALPLQFGDHAEGLLVIERERPFSVIEHEQLGLLANQGALALSHLRLFEERLRDEKLALVGRIAGAICDRIRRPMDVIRETGEALEVDDPDYQKMILDNVDRLGLMCDELSDFVTGELAVRREPRSVRGLLDELVREQRPRLEARAIELRLEAPEDLVYPLDEPKFRRALLNLINNAADAIQGSGRIDLALRREPNRLVIEVSDTGCGMPPEVQARVFEPFFTHGKAGGTGLGGAVIRSAVTAHQGEIEIKSVVGEGSKIRLLLPTRPIAEAAG